MNFELVFGLINIELVWMRVLSLAIRIGASHGDGDVDSVL